MGERAVGVVRLRGVVEGDLAGLFEYHADPEGNRMVPMRARDWDAHRAHWAKVLANPENLVRAIEVDGRLAGDIGSWTALPAERGVGEGERLVGYWIGRKWWGRGVATRALGAYLLEVERARPLLAHLAESNLGSRCWRSAGSVW